MPAHTKIHEGQRRDFDFLFRDKYGGKWSPKMLVDIRRLCVGEPLAYVIGWVPFFGAKIDLSTKPLIPRPETEYWVSEFIKSIEKKSAGASLRIADVFAGSGAIGIAVLKHLPRAKVDFFEIEKKLIPQIKKNLRLNKIPADRARVFESDILKQVKDKYDFILGNPPYLSNKNIKRIEESVLKYEPKRALFGGKNGISIIKRFVKETKKHLKKSGELWFEFDSPQKLKINSLLKKEGYREIEFKRDGYNKWRFLRAKAK